VRYLTSLTRNEFLTTRAWHRAIVGGKDMILRRTSALEYLELFNGYMHEKSIDVYAKQSGEYGNINYHVVDSFDGIDYNRFDDVLCTSVKQAFNDMLSDYENIDELSLIEGLSGFYYSNGESFDGMVIAPENMERFNTIKNWAIEYYDEG
jgi:hypothetical protein